MIQLEIRAYDIFLITFVIYQFIGSRINAGVIC